eukprot:1169210_1
MNCQIIQRLIKENWLRITFATMLINAFAIFLLMIDYMILKNEGIRDTLVPSYYFIVMAIISIAPKFVVAFDCKEWTPFGAANLSLSNVIVCWKRWAGFKKVDRNDSRSKMEPAGRALCLIYLDFAIAISGCLDILYAEIPTVSVAVNGALSPMDTGSMKFAYVTSYPVSEIRDLCVDPTISPLGAGTLEYTSVLDGGGLAKEEGGDGDDCSFDIVYERLLIKCKHIRFFVIYTSYFQCQCYVFVPWYHIRLKYSVTVVTDVSPAKQRLLLGDDMYHSVHFMAMVPKISMNTQYIAFWFSLMIFSINFLFEFVLCAVYSHFMIY